MHGLHLNVARHRFSIIVVLTIGLLTGSLVGLWSPSAADVVGPKAQDRTVTNIVTKWMAEQHLSRHPLDDEISKRGLKSFLSGLDPMKIYFYKSDIDEFQRYETQLDDMLRQLDTRFAYAVFKRFLERVDERVAVVDELLKEEFDFTQQEQLITDADQLSYPATEEEARERWRKRLKYDLLLLKADKTEGQEAIDRLTRRYQNFARRMHQFDNDEVLEMFLTAVTTAYDPHTTYMSASTLDNFRIALGLNLEGIGAQLKDEDGQTVVAKVIPGGAADKHGKLQAEDRIVSVGQDDEGEMVDVIDMKLNDVVKLIRGTAGTVVRLGVMPADSNDVRVYKITRAKIELTDSAAAGKVFEQGTAADGSPFKIGVIDLPSFYMDMEGARQGLRDFRSTTVDVRRILDDFKTQGVDAVVLDLRRNGGGSLTEAINLTGLFIDQGPVVQVKGPDNRVQHYDDFDPGMAWDGPLVVVTSKLSASASEILAGAIQDYRRGLIVGDETTHGKGTVQSLLDLGSEAIGGPRAPNLGALKITMQQFYRPNGDSTQQRGVLADIVLPSITNYMDIGEADLDYAIEFDKVKRAEYSALNMVTPELLGKLRGESTQRLRDSSGFEEALKKIERYRAQKEKKRIDLNEERFFAERAELDADKEEERQLDETQNGSDTIERDYYLDEVLAIASDYVRELASRDLARVN